MKTKATTATLSLALLLFVAAGTMAQEGILAPAGSPYLINSTADASAVNPVTYQWYRNGSPISGATSASYTVPAAQATGSSVEFKRHVSTQGCSGELEGYSNTVTVTFVNLTLNGVRWADANVDSYQTFAAKPDMYTKFYQWNRATAYATTGTTASPTWNTIANTDATWSPNPCPAGWRLPTRSEFDALIKSGSSTWALVKARGNDVVGKFFGPRASATTPCSLPNDMAGCIFLPAVGVRQDTDGVLKLQGTNGDYWTSEEVETNSLNGYHLFFNTSGDNPAASTTNKAWGFPLRCVK